MPPPRARRSGAFQPAIAGARSLSVVWSLIERWICLAVGPRLAPESGSPVPVGSATTSVPATAVEAAPPMVSPLPSEMVRLEDDNGRCAD